MSGKILRTLTALAVLVLPTLSDFHVQPVYQVTIMLELQHGNPIHLCNGCIIYERLIATTANCVHFRFGPKSEPTMLEPSALSVWAGSTIGGRNVFRVNITRINLAAGFNTDTLENDLALLTLGQSLPLGMRPDMTWITLDDSEHVNHSCLVNFFSRNSKTAIPNYYQTEELHLYNNAMCRNLTIHPTAREPDICSRYVLPHQFSCEEAESFLSFNNDRGSGLVCKNYLVGLLSSVVTRPDPKTNCSDVSLTAMYTNIFPHLMWVYSVMVNIETKFISTPFDASRNSLLTDTATTLKDYRENEIMATTTFLPPPQYSASILQRTTTISILTTISSTTVTKGNSTTTGSVTEGSLVENSTIISPTPVTGEASVSWNETTLPTSDGGAINTTVNINTSVSSNLDTEVLVTTTVLPPLVENTTSQLNSTPPADPTTISSTTMTSISTTSDNSTTIGSTPATEEPLLGKIPENQTESTLQPHSYSNATTPISTTNSTIIPNTTTISPTFATDETVLENSTTIQSITRDETNSTTTANLTTLSPTFATDRALLENSTTFRSTTADERSNSTTTTNSTTSSPTPIISSFSGHENTTTASILAKKENLGSTNSTMASEPSEISTTPIISTTELASPSADNATNFTMAPDPTEKNLLPPSSNHELNPTTAQISTTTTPTTLLNDGPVWTTTASSSVPASTWNLTNLLPPSSEGKVNSTIAPTSTTLVNDGPAGTTTEASLITFTERNASTLTSDDQVNSTTTPTSTTESPATGSTGTTTESSLMPSTERTASTSNLTHLLPTSTDISTIDAISPTSPTGNTTIPRPPYNANATKGLNSTNNLVTETTLLAQNLTTLPSQSSPVNHVNFTNFTAEFSSEEGTSNWNDTELLPFATATELNKNLTEKAKPAEIRPTPESVEVFTEQRTTIPSTTSTTTATLNSIPTPTPTTPTAPDPTDQMKWNFTMVRPLLTVLLEPFKESAQESIEGFFRSSATSSHQNALCVLIAFLLLQLILKL